MIDRALHEKPADATHWSTHGMGAGISASTVSHWFRLSGLKPHLAKTCKLSADPCFIEKVRDIAALYIDPPGHATVLRVDELSQTQGLERIQPQPPLDVGYVAPRFRGRDPRRLTVPCPEVPPYAAPARSRRPVAWPAEGRALPGEPDQRRAPAPPRGRPPRPPSRCQAPPTARQPVAGSAVRIEGPDRRRHRQRPPACPHGS